MSEMVERVARALQDGDDAFPSGSPIDPWYRSAAMAAIEAMREPSDDMKSTDDDANATYRAMIDRALK